VDYVSTTCKISPTNGNRGPVPEEMSHALLTIRSKEKEIHLFQLKTGGAQKDLIIHDSYLG
jgi:hypothetical protein